MTPVRDEDEDDEWEDTVYLGYDSDEEPTVPCPHCGLYILEDTPRCPYCEQYVSDADHPGTTKPMWVIVTALGLLGIAVWCGFVAF